MSLIRGAPRRAALAGVAVLATAVVAGPAIAQGLGESGGQPPAGTAPVDPSSVTTVPLGGQPAPGARPVVLDPAPLGSQPAPAGTGGVDGSASGSRSD